MVDRLAHFRSPAKAETSKFIPYFKLGLGEDCKERVASLMSNFSFYFPGSWGGNNGNVRSVKVNLFRLVTSCTDLAAQSQGGVSEPSGYQDHTSCLLFEPQSHWLSIRQPIRLKHSFQEG